MESKGRFIAFEGIDGSGKETQVKLLVDRLRSEGMLVTQIGFPRYGNPSARLVEEYLKGKFGPLDKLDPKQVSRFYAEDRQKASPEIRQYLKQGHIVISDRFTGSNMGHQGSRLINIEDRHRLIRWIYDYEYTICQIPKPDLNIFLRVPFQISFEAVKRRNQAKGSSGDIHENDPDHLHQAAIAYDQVCSIYKQEFVVIECAEASQMRPKDEIHDLIMQALIVHGGLGF